MMEKHLIPDTLNIKGNKLTPKCLSLLSSFIENTENLKTLILEWNNLNDRKALKEFLRVIEKTGLTFLDLKSNKISNENADIFVDFISSCKILKNLDLSWNDLGNRFGERVNDAIDCDNSLLRLGLNGNGIDQGILDQIEGKLLKKSGNQKLNSEKKDVENWSKEFSKKVEFSVKKVEFSGKKEESFEKVNQVEMETNKMSLGLHEMLREDILREKRTNDELIGKFDELTKIRNIEKNERETCEMKSNKKKPVFYFGKRKIKTRN